MMKTFRNLITVLIAVVLTIPMAAQTTVNTTTLSAAVTKSQTQVTVASATNVAVGNILYVDREAMKVVTLSGTNATVRRGQEGTAAVAHASGAVVYTAAPQYFYATEVSGTCTSTDEIALPHISVATGNIYTCTSGGWTVTRRGGISATSRSRLGNGGTDYTAAGAITIEPGTVWINGTTLAMTIANPTTDQNGLEMCIMAANSSAHTLTYTAGFNGGTTARDVATWTAGIGNGMCIIARNGVWYTTLLLNVALG